MTKLSFSWSLRREGNSGYVLESRSDGTQTEFGPMPAHVTPSFAMGRRRLVALRMARSGNPLTEQPTLSDEDLLLFQ